MSRKRLTREEEEAMFGGPDPEPSKYIPTEFSEKHDGPTPNGGAFSVGYFYDKNHKPCHRENARFINIIEYDENGIYINETAALFGSDDSNE